MSIVCTFQQVLDHEQSLLGPSLVRGQHPQLLVCLQDRVLVGRALGHQLLLSLDQRVVVRLQLLEDPLLAGLPALLVPLAVPVLELLHPGLGAGQLFPGVFQRQLGIQPSAFERAQRFVVADQRGVAHCRIDGVLQQLLQPLAQVNNVSQDVVPFGRRVFDQDASDDPFGVRLPDERMDLRLGPHEPRHQRASSQVCGVAPADGDVELVHEHFALSIFTHGGSPRLC
jgi:hypothetical protein